MERKTKEDVINALSRHVSDDGDCKGCPYKTDPSCMQLMAQDAVYYLTEGQLVPDVSAHSTGEMHCHDGICEIDFDAIKGQS